MQSPGSLRIFHPENPKGMWAATPSSARSSDENGFLDITVKGREWGSGGAAALSIEIGLFVSIISWKIHSGLSKHRNPIPSFFFLADKFPHIYVWCSTIRI